MGDISGGELLMECLANQGTSIIFGIPDGGFNIMFKWTHFNGEKRNLRFVTPRHEAAGAHMADAMARVTGKPGVAIAGAGPGAANLVSGVITAHAENIPMIVLTTSRRTDMISPPRGGMQVFDQVALFKPVTKLSAMLTCWERIPELVALAYRTSLSGIPGPVHLDIPEDMLNARKPESAAAPCPSVYETLGTCGADENAVAKAAEMLVNAKEPMIHVGAAVWKSDATPELVGLAEYLGIPVSESPTARGAMPEDHPQCVSSTAMLARAAMSQSDVVFAVGCKFGELDFFGKAPLWGAPGKQKLIHNHIAPECVGVNKKADVALIGNCRIVLKQLLEAVKKLTPKRPEHPKVKQYRDLIEMGKNDLHSKYATGKSPIVTGELVLRLRGFFPKETIFAHDGGNTSLWSSFFNEFYGPRTLLWTGDFGHLGTGLPYAIGAKLAAPEKPVCLISGDGAFGFNIQELETAKRNKVNIIAVVAVDAAWGMEKTSQNRTFGTSDYYVNCEHSPVRYDKVAEAMGCFGAYVQRVDALRPALQAAAESNMPAVVHVVVDAEANAAPPGSDVWAATHSTK
jgi:acetolactate synthase-1/2/3 large subunit